MKYNKNFFKFLSSSFPIFHILLRIKVFSKSKVKRLYKNEIYVTMKDSKTLNFFLIK